MSHADMFADYLSRFEDNSIWAFQQLNDIYQEKNLAKRRELRELYNMMFDLKAKEEAIGLMHDLYGRGK